MTNTALAEYANLTLYSAMAVLTLAMVGYAAHLAWLLPARDQARTDTEARARVLVRAGSGTEGADAGGDEAGAEDAAAAPAGGLDPEPLRSRKAAAIAWMLTLLGTVLLVVSAVLRGVSVQRWPLGNMFEFAVVGCMFLMLAYCAWGLRRDVRWLGLFVVAPVLLTLGMAVTVWYTEAAELMPSLKSVWLAIHVTVATISVAFFVIGFSLGVLYLVQDRVEASARRSFMNRLPRAKVLERMAYGMHIVAFPLWTFTVIAGAIWARQAWGSYWNWDPKEVWSFVIWVVYAAYLHARATSGWSRQSATVIALAGFGCILANYAVVNVFFVGQHSYSGL
ncbi:MAG TPA: c-type cytochrome biogenesis protein CcsB [Dermatophilaceae bacterium]|nr:c-type cytochrome biogenesis protein CcsB [Dermatophilaceae bacterium]